MKKNKLMRLASMLLVLTLLSTCAISGTFAKYVTSGEGSDTARVAKFGVTVDATSSTMFNTSYTTDDNGYTGSGTVSVESSTSGNVVAPGTRGNMVAIEITGTPEVAVRVSYDVDVTLTNWVYSDGQNSSYYCPLKITVNDSTYYGLDYADAAAFEAAVKAAISDYSKDYAPNTILDNQSADDLTISWSWAFEGSDGLQTDVKDTYLGDQAAAGSAAEINIVLTCTVTQID